MLIVDGVNISKLTDDELFQKLRQLGVNAGPIIESTRAVYERKLAQLLKGEPQVESSSYLDQDTLDQEYFHTHESELHRRLLLTANSPEPFSGYGLNRTKRLEDYVSSSTHFKSSQHHANQTLSKTSWLRSIVVVVIVVVTLLLALLVYHNMEESVPAIDVQV